MYGIHNDNFNYLRLRGVVLSLPSSISSPTRKRKVGKKRDGGLPSAKLGKRNGGKEVKKERDSIEVCQQPFSRLWHGVRRGHVDMSSSLPIPLRIA